MNIAFISHASVLNGAPISLAELVEEILYENGRDDISIGLPGSGPLLKKHSLSGADIFFYAGGFMGREILVTRPKIKNKLVKVRKNRSLQRKQRKISPVPLVSIVGYTSAGKSTLFNLLTEEKVFVSKKLFSTLDPLVRKVDLRENGEGYYCLMSDTVGFIRDMPKELITSFHATLEEVSESDIVLLLSDISDPDHNNQNKEVTKVLKTLGINEDRILKIYNKIDKIENYTEIIGKKNGNSLECLYISAKMGIGMKELKKALFKKFFESYGRFKFSMHNGDPKVKNISSWAIILNKTYEGETIRYDVLCEREKMLELSDDKKEI